MAGKPLFRTAGNTGVVAGDPPVRPDVQTPGPSDAGAAERPDAVTPVHLEGLTPSRQDAQGAVSPGAGTPERPDAGTAGRSGAEAARRTDAKEARRSVINDAGTSGRPDAEEATVAFSWRMPPDEAMDLDLLVLTLRRRLGGGRLDKKDVLRELVVLAKDNDYVQSAVMAAIRGEAA